MRESIIITPEDMKSLDLGGKNGIEHIPGYFNVPISLKVTKNNDNLSFSLLVLYEGELKEEAKSLPTNFSDIQVDIGKSTKRVVAIKGLTVKKLEQFAKNWNAKDLENGEIVKTILNKFMRDILFRVN